MSTAFARRPIALAKSAAALTMLFCMIACVILVGLVAFRRPETPPRHTDRELAAGLTLFEHAVVEADAATSITTAAIDLSVCGLRDKEVDYARRLTTAFAAIDAKLKAMAQVGGDRGLPTVYVVDRSRWIQALNADVAAGNSCVGALRAADWLARNDGAALDTLRWRDHSAPSRRASFGDKALLVEAVHLSRTSPWGGLPGCIVMTNGPTRYYWPLGPASEQVCAERAGFAAKPLPVDAHPPGMQDVITALGVYRERWGASDATPNRIDIDGHTIPMGAHVELTISPKDQALANNVVACHTGDAGACAAIGMPADRWATRYEAAAARMVGLIMVDIPTGGIDVLASGHTKCYESEHDGPGRLPGCPDLPTTPRWRPHMLENHAFGTAAMPGSLVKPNLAIGILKALDSGNRFRDPGSHYLIERIIRAIQRSDSRAFLDRAFCRDQGWQDCGRLSLIQSTAAEFGWNNACRDSNPCGFRDLLFASGSGGSGTFPVFFGRMLVEPNAGHGYSPMDTTFDGRWAARCAGREWSHCAGGRYVDLAAETWGQGHALASPVGIALMFQRLGKTVNVEPGTPANLRLVRKVYGQVLTPEPSNGDDGPVINLDYARVVVEGMSRTHRSGGTAHSACAAVFGVRDCNSIDWLAGKTGTPAFEHDRLTLAQRRALCTQNSPTGRTGAARLRAACAMAPYKWYAALVADKDGGPFRKLVVVLAERNWDRVSGRVDSAGDFGPNIAAEMALRFIQLRKRESQPGGEPTR